MTLAPSRATDLPVSDADPFSHEVLEDPLPMHEQLREGLDAVVGVDVGLKHFAVLSDGTTEGNRAAFFMIGTFMALWIILYGAVQAAAPRLLGGRHQPEDAITAKAVRWAAYLVPIPLALAAAAWFRTWSLQVVVAVTVVALGCTTSITNWDAAKLSESLALSHGPGGRGVPGPLAPARARDRARSGRRSWRGP